MAVAGGEAAGGSCGGASSDPRSGIGPDRHWMEMGINCIYSCNVACECECVWCVCAWEEDRVGLRVTQV